MPFVCCIKSSYDNSSPTGGHAATNRPTTVGSAAATFAANDAPSPSSSATHGNTPARSPARRRTSIVIDAATASPSTEIGNSHDRHPSPANAASARMCSYDATAATAATATTAAVVMRRTHTGAAAPSGGPNGSGVTASTGARPAGACSRTPGPGSA